MQPATVRRRFRRIDARPRALFARSCIQLLRPVGCPRREILSGKGDGTSQSTRALLRLRELILSGEFAAGTRMSELPLVERLGVSRTPLRLALATLEHEGLPERLGRGGHARAGVTLD